MKINAQIDRMVNSGNVKAIASLSLDGMFVVKGLKVMDGRKGLFVSMPQESYSGKDGQKQYSNLFFALTNSAKMQLQDVVLDAYKIKLDPNYTPRQQNGQEPDQYQYPEPHYPELDFTEPEYPEYLGGCDNILPMGIY